MTLNPTGDDGRPGDALCTLDDPATFTSSGVNTFTAPTTGDDRCPTLAADESLQKVVVRLAVQGETERTQVCGR